MDDRYLAEPWLTCFELSWEAYRTGSVPVGAVVVDSEGAIVATGRNNRFGLEAPAGQLANTAISHAEINAIAGLPQGNYADYILYTTLEPCLLCTAAMAHARVGRTRYAAADPVVAGIERVPEVLGYVVGRWPVREGPLEPQLAAVSLLLNLLFWLEYNPRSAVVSTAETELPGLIAVGRSLVGAGETQMLKSLSASTAFGRLLEHLPD
jgi:tRNA(adenine34) deaminase